VTTSMNPELTPEVRAELRAQLQQKRDRLESQIAARRRAEGFGGTPEQDPETDIRGDIGDESVELETWDIAHQERLDLDAQLAEVVHALGKFDAGTYGICESCGRPIPLARLRVIPEARYDIEEEAHVEAHRGITDDPPDAD
jgi:DnaK suppressor protein